MILGNIDFTLREVHQISEFFLVLIFQHLHWIVENEDLKKLQNSMHVTYFTVYKDLRSYYSS